MEAYIDDMLVKSKSREDHLAHVLEAFRLMRLHCLRLKPKKCAFGVKSRNFLGFLVSQRGIEMVPRQVKSIGKLQSPIIKKQIQALTRKSEVLNRFIFRYSDRLWSFFSSLKGASSQGWGPECDKTFHIIKEYIASPLSLSPPVDDEELYLYLEASAMAMRAALVRTNGDGRQKPFYFINKILTDAETRYTNFELIALALKMATNKLHLYFQAYIIVILTSYPIRVILQMLRDSSRNGPLS